MTAFHQVCNMHVLDLLMIDCVMFLVDIAHSFHQVWNMMTYACMFSNSAPMTGLFEREIRE